MGIRKNKKAKPIVFDLAYNIFLEIVP